MSGLAAGYLVALGTASVLINLVMAGKPREVDKHPDGWALVAVVVLNAAVALAGAYLGGWIG